VRELHFSFQDNLTERRLALLRDSALVGSLRGLLAPLWIKVLYSSDCEVRNILNIIDKLFKPCQGTTGSYSIDDVLYASV